MSTVILGQACSSEYGTHWGEPGRQREGELATSNWVLNNKDPWNYVFEPKDPMVAEALALSMEAAIANYCIGYSQDNGASPRTTLYDEAKKYGFSIAKVAKPVNTDCSALIGVCCAAAGINNSRLRDMYTGSEYEILKSTGMFKIHSEAEWTKSESLLTRGCILLKRNEGFSGHTAMTLHGAVKVEFTDPMALITNCVACNLRKGPGTNHEAYKNAIPGNTFVPCYGVDVMTGWVRVSYGENAGYTSKLYTKILQVAKISGGSVFIRETAGALGKNTNVVMHAGDKCSLVGEKKNVLGTTWYKVFYKGTVGWASGKYVKPE